MKNNFYSKEFRQSISKIIREELKEDPYYKFKLVFALMGVIPLLAFSYILFVLLPQDNLRIEDISVIMYLLVTISVLAFALGYQTIKKLLNKIIFFAGEVKRNEQLQADLAASVSHDFEIPVGILKENIANIVNGSCGTLNDEQRKHLASCQETLSNMRSTIKTLLDLYKIKSGLVTLHKENCDLMRLVSDKIAEFSASFEERNIRCNIKHPTKVSFVKIDQDKIKEVINNLFSNFLKYTPKDGWVEVRFCATRDFLRIEFVNNSSLIPEDKLGAIFEKFKKLDSSKEGSGLGLAISKDIIELHGGNLWAENLSKGVMFVLLLPCS